jgi:hypothetical protein
LGLRGRERVVRLPVRNWVLDGLALDYAFRFADLHVAFLLYGFMTVTGTP